MHRPTLLVLLAAAAAPTAARAQVAWTLLNPPVKPPMRAWMAMAYDLLRDRVVMTGGFENVTFTALNDTWEFDGTAWTLVPATTSPARDCMYMTFAISTGRTVLFGGLDNGFARLADTWEYDGTAWTQTAVSGPSARVYMPLCYDLARDRVVGFGGGQQALSLGDTWEYDPQLRTWTQRAPATNPPSREGAGLVYDRRRDRVVMHGGWDSAAGIRSDTWTWDGTDWQPVATPAAPTPRMCFTMVYDELRDRVLLHGGADVNFTVNFTDTWEFDAVTWTQLLPANPGPGLPGSGMAHRSATGTSYVFGGEDAPTGLDTDQIWELRTVAPAAATTFGAGCPGSAGVPRLQPLSLPWLGDPTDLLLTNLPAAPGAAIVVLGFSATQWQNQPLPLPLAGFGLPGCNLLVSVDSTRLLLHGGGQLTDQLAIPNVPGLVGVLVHGQGLSLDAAAPGGVGAVSDGVRLQLGSR